MKLDQKRAAKKVIKQVGEKRRKRKVGIMVKMKLSQKVQMRSQPRNLKPSDLSSSTRVWKRKLRRLQKSKLVVGKTAIPWRMELRILLEKMTMHAIPLMTILSMLNLCQR